MDLVWEWQEGNRRKPERPMSYVQYVRLVEEVGKVGAVTLTRKRTQVEELMERLDSVCGA